MINFAEHKPATLEEAIQIVAQYLNDEEIAYIETEGANSAHHGFGTQMRNEWGLWHKSPLAKHFEQRFGLGHADDMSGLILSGVEAKVKKLPFDPAPLVEDYKKFWRQQSIDPLTQNEIAA